jgi:hypothetical protein
MMKNRQIVLTAILSTFFTLSIIAGSLLFFGRVGAAPPAQVVVTPTASAGTSAAYLSISGLGFMPVGQDTLYVKDVHRQLLMLTSQPLGAPRNGHLFIAPLALPNGIVLTGMTIFGEDFDNQGAVQVRLKRCDHSLARCINLAETTSTNPYAAGQFESLKAAISNERVDNYFYTYFLELTLTTTANSGLRSVRLEMVDGETSAPAKNVEQWALTGHVTNFLLPNQGPTKARICTDDLSHLDNPTHYPQLVVDGQIIPLSSNRCMTVWGYDIDIRRELNAGPSSGTYQFQ